VSLQASTTRIEPGIVVVHLSGTLTLSKETGAALPSISDLLQQNEKKLILDLGGIETMDSSGMQVVFDSFSAVREAGGELRVAGARVRVARLFRLTQIDTVVPFYPTVDAACQGFHLKATAPGQQS
jgi:anti-sigma B factor antagonist